MERGEPIEIRCPLCARVFIDTSHRTTVDKAVGDGWFPPTELIDEIRCPHCPHCEPMLLVTFVRREGRLVPQRVNRHPLEERQIRRLGYPSDMTLRGPGGREITVGELNANKEPVADAPKMNMMSDCRASAGAAAVDRIQRVTFRLRRNVWFSSARGWTSK